MYMGYVYYVFHAIFIELIDLSVRICAIDTATLRSLKYDSQAKCGRDTHLFI
jgi:hypothetical protein